MIDCRNANTTELDNGRRAVTMAKVKTMPIGNTGTNEKHLKQHRAQRNCEWNKLSVTHIRQSWYMSCSTLRNQPQ